MIRTRSDFVRFSQAGKELLGLHLGYEIVEPYPLVETTTFQTGDNQMYRVAKMRFGKIGRGEDRSAIIYNSHVTLSGIPEEAHDYTLASRSAIGWIMERYQVKTDKVSGIVNDPNDWCDEVGDPRYIIDLVKRIVTVSVETVRIVNSLPPLEIA